MSWSSFTMQNQTGLHSDWLKRAQLLGSASTVCKHSSFIKISQFSILLEIILSNDSSDEFQLLDISDDGFVSLMDEKGDLRDDLRIPSDEELAKKIREELDKSEGNVIITVLSAVGEEAIVACKNST